MKDAVNHVSRGQLEAEVNHRYTFYAIMALSHLFYTISPISNGLVPWNVHYLQRYDVAEKGSNTVETQG